MSIFDFNKTLGNYLKEARLSSDMSQKEVSNHLNFSSAQFISNIERGKCAVPRYVLRELVHLYGIDKNIFIGLVMKWSEKSLRNDLKRK